MADVVWLTADVHYTAAHRYSPERAVFTEFDEFWEFVSGPLNAGALSVRLAPGGREVKWSRPACPVISSVVRRSG
ncbi:alkaline phosphatase D family protein [Nocardia abscessus]|uniref:alkaline phosphatase D family protein n=1 Tax=Nocardia abscessus TaxID=120957 RepID=UPI002455572B|nr:alkaline phosphatase D family protein [Nocardia abscessus]